jgi:hypothetical protein
MDQRDLGVQNDPQYKDKTALVCTTDHGHGDTVSRTSHGNKFEGSSGIYFAAMGPKLKVRRNKKRISIVSK